MVGRTNPYDLEPIKGYPKLQIYRIPASSFYQVRLFVGRNYLRKSTQGVRAKAEAIKFAKRYYDDVKLAERLDFEIHQDTFAACANLLMKRQQDMVARGERDDRFIAEDRKKLGKVGLWG